MSWPLCGNAIWNEEKKVAEQLFGKCKFKTSPDTQTPDMQTRYNNGDARFPKLKWKQVKQATKSDVEVALHTRHTVHTICPQGEKEIMHPTFVNRVAPPCSRG